MSVPQQATPGSAAVTAAAEPTRGASGRTNAALEPSGGTPTLAGNAGKTSVSVSVPRKRLAAAFPGATLPRESSEDVYGLLNRARFAALAAATLETTTAHEEGSV